VLRKPVGGEPSDQFIGIAGALLAVVMPQRKGERLCKSFVIGKPQFSVFVWPHGCLSCPVLYLAKAHRFCSLYVLTASYASQR
jgi:hypothetical protein